LLHAWPLRYSAAAWATTCLACANGLSVFVFVWADDRPTCDGQRHREAPVQLARAHTAAARGAVAL
jgi:hypothetical protein